MITQELLEYIRKELAKGRTREEIRVGLVDSGWSEIDISEAFRIVIPMQGFFAPDTSATKSIENKKRSKTLWEIIMFVMIVLVCATVWYFFNPQIISFWNYSIDNITDFTATIFNKSKDVEVTVTEPVASPEIHTIKDCGVVTKIDLKSPEVSSADHEALSCIGSSALSCEDAKVIVNSDLFPTIFQIMPVNNNCYFRISYTKDSPLVGVDGNKLAGQNISCPVGIVKELDESNPKLPVFEIPSKDNFEKYASDIYLYGTIGVFMENNLDQNRINGLGCSGEYIKSVITSYQKR